MLVTNGIEWEHRYPFDKIRNLKEVQQEPNERGFTFQFRTTKSVVKKNKMKSTMSSGVTLCPSKNEADVRECWNAINEYKKAKL